MNGLWFSIHILLMLSFMFGVESKMFGFSGGGFRSATYTYETLNFLENIGLLKHGDTISGVSGGSWGINSFLNRKLVIPKNLNIPSLIIECHPSAKVFLDKTCGINSDFLSPETEKAVQEKLLKEKEERALNEYFYWHDDLDIIKDVLFDAYLRKDCVNNPTITDIAGLLPILNSGTCVFDKWSSYVDRYFSQNGANTKFKINHHFLVYHQNNPSLTFSCHSINNTNIINCEGFSSFISQTSILGSSSSAIMVDTRLIGLPANINIFKIPDTDLIINGLKMNKITDHGVLSNLPLVNSGMLFDWSFVRDNSEITRFFELKEVDVSKLSNNKITKGNYSIVRFYTNNINNNFVVMKFLKFNKPLSLYWKTDQLNIPEADFNRKRIELREVLSLFSKEILEYRRNIY